MKDTVLISLGRLAEEKSVDIVIRAVKAATVAGESCQLASCRWRAGFE